MEDMENLKNGFFTKGVFNINSAGENETDGFSQESRVLAEFTEKKIDRDDHRPNIPYTGDTFSNFRNF